jgi:hypothetical protein
MLNLFAAIAASIALSAAAVSTAPASAVASASAIVPQQTATANKPVRREPHPEIRKAIAALERAKKDMQLANHDFGGHRADALVACDKAIEQLRLALQYDKR